MFSWILEFGRLCSSSSCEAPTALNFGFRILDFGRLCSHSSFAAPLIQHLAFGFLVLNGLGPFRSRRPGSAYLCLVMMMIGSNAATKVVMMMLIGYDTIMYQSAWRLVFKHGHAKPSNKNTTGKQHFQHVHL